MVVILWWSEGKRETCTVAEFGVISAGQTKLLKVTSRSNTTDASGTFGWDDNLALINTSDGAVSRNYSVVDYTGSFDPVTGASRL